MVKNLPAVWETWVRFLGWEDPLKKELATLLVFLPGESHGQRSLVDHGVSKSWTQFSRENCRAGHRTNAKDEPE